MVIIHVALYILYLAIMVRAIWKAPFFAIKEVNPRHLLLFFGLKVLAGATLTLVYTYYYTDPTRADIYRYFNDSKIITRLLFEHPRAWLAAITGHGLYDPQNFKYLLNTQYFTHPEGDISTNNMLIVRLCSLLNFASVNNIYINTLLFNFSAFTGLVALFKFFRPYFPQTFRALYLPLFLFPSAVLWGSGLLKEQLLFTFLGFFLWISDRQGIIKWAGMALLWWAMWTTKPSVALCMLPVIFLLPGVIAGIKWRTIAMALVGLTLTGGAFLNAGKYQKTLLTKRSEFIQLAANENAGSFVDTTHYRHMGVPALKGTLTAIAGPFVWNEGNVPQLAFAIENILFLALLALLLLKYFEWPIGERRWLFYFCLGFSLLNYLAIGITVPVMGAIVHYRVVAGVFLFLAVLLCTNLSRVKASAGLNT